MGHIIIAIDPGDPSGAVTFYTHGKPLNSAITKPLVPGKLIHQIVQVQTCAAPFTVLVEKLTGTGGAQPFKLAQNYGTILGILMTLDIDPVLVLPQVWQRPWSREVSGLPYASRKAALHKIAADEFDVTLPKDHADSLMIAAWSSTKTVANLRDYHRP